MWEANTGGENSFKSIDNIETLAFGISDDLYQVSGTKTINLSGAVQQAGVSTIDASNTSGNGDLVINAFQFSRSTNITFIGSADKDVNVHFAGGSGHDTPQLESF